MTKKLLLAAVAVSAIAFAGAATAGTITTTKRTIASEVKLPAAGLDGAIAAGTTMTNPVSVAVAGEATYTVKYTLTGATFDGAPTIVSTGAADVAGQGGTVYIQTDGSAVAIITIKNAGAAAADLTGFSLTGNITVAAKGDVKLASEVSVTSGSLTLPIDNASATTIAEFKPLLAGFESTAGSDEAKLPNYIAFAGGASDAQLATGIKVKVNAGAFVSDLAGTAVDAADMITGLTATVAGSAGAQLDKLDLAIGASTTVEAGATDTSAVIKLAAPDLAAALGAGVDFKIDNVDDVALNGAAYSMTFAPTYAAAFEGPASFGPVAAGEVTLEGTNFAAPWFTLNNANNTAFLRLANNGTVATGPVFVSLKANNGTAAPTSARVKVADSIAPNGIYQVTGPELAALFGTDAQNGDLAVTIQGDGKVISGKVRVRNATGALSEQSLGNISN
jgi:hypothetical protein